MSDENHVERLRAAECEVTRLRDVVRGAWRFWAAIKLSDPPVLDRGFVILRVSADQYDDFDAIWSGAARPADPGPGGR